MEIGQKTGPDPMEPNQDLDERTYGKGMEVLRFRSVYPLFMNGSWLSSRTCGQLS